MGSDWAGLTDGEREPYVAAAKDATDDLWVCTRVWEAWSVGTMTECDFRRASHDDDVVNDVAAAAYAAGATLRARAEAAEQRAEALATELAQARADRALMTGRYLATVGEEYVAGVLMPAGLDHDEAMATYLVQGDAYGAPDTEVVAVIRRTLGGAA